MDRSQLIGTLMRLTPADFGLIVTLIPGAAHQVSRLVTVAEQVAELIRWAESPAGPGLPAIEDAYRNF
jgi:hypothetical protein